MTKKLEEVFNIPSEPVIEPTTETPSKPAVIDLQE
jgi:hypothetical protein